MSGNPLHRPRWRRAVRVVRTRPRLFACALVCLVLIATLPASWRLTTRLLTAWDVGTALYLVAACVLMARADVEHIRRQSAVLDEGQVAILIVTVAAARASVAASIMELGGTRGSAPDLVRLGLATSTIVLSWAFIHMMFALHYAHEFYAERHRGASGLAFPGAEPPDYWDFVYFSFVIGMTSQVSDVAVTSKAIRKTVAAHGVVSFMFNVALLALMVNIAATAI